MLYFSLSTAISPVHSAPLRHRDSAPAPLTQPASRSAHNPPPQVLEALSPYYAKAFPAGSTRSHPTKTGVAVSSQEQKLPLASHEPLFLDPVSSSEPPGRCAPPGLSCLLGTGCPAQTELGAGQLSPRTLRLPAAARRCSTAATPRAWTSHSAFRHSQSLGQT